ncbi:unnamed protein product [Effrenium voratum]|uniref:WWE domain-containing protein n=1 Tax=Effrenium voratum TaxID=2562239 RepID=A0AA36J1Y1_9DINO|nr:unnamed protein product [Effrenium voratum]
MVAGEPPTLSQKVKRVVSQELCALFLQLQQMYKPVCVIQASPEEAAVLEFASQVGQELTAWAAYLREASEASDSAAAVDLVARAQQLIWANIQELTGLTGQFSNAAKVLLEGCSKRAAGPVARTLSGFPPLETPSCFMVAGEPPTLSQKVKSVVSQELCALFLQLQQMYKPVCVIQASPEEAAVLEFASQVGQELTAWAAYLREASEASDSAAAVDLVARAQQLIWANIQELTGLTGQFSNAAKVLLEGCSKRAAGPVARTLSGFPPLETPSCFMVAGEPPMLSQKVQSVVSQELCALFLQLQQMYKPVCVIQASPEEAAVLEFACQVGQELTAWAAYLREASEASDSAAAVDLVARAQQLIWANIQELTGLTGQFSNAAKVLLEGCSKRAAGPVARTLSGFPPLETPSCFMVAGEPPTLSHQKVKRVVSQELCALFLQLQQMYKPVSVIQASPEEAAVLEFASQVGQELTAWAAYLREAPEASDSAAAVDLVARAQQLIWANIQKLTGLTGQFSNAAKVLLEGCSKRAAGPVARTLSGFPPLQTPSCFMVAEESPTPSQKVKRVVSQELNELFLQLQEMYKGCLLQPTEEEESLLDYAAQIEHELLGCSLPSDVLDGGVDFAKISAEMVSGARRQIWAEIVKRDSTNAAKILFSRQKNHSESQKSQESPETHVPQVPVYHKHTSVSGFPVFLFPFEAEKPSKGPLQQVRLAASQYVQSEFGALASKSDLKYIQAAMNESVVTHTLRSDPTVSCRMEVDREDHGLAAMDDILVGPGFDGLNRVKGLGSVLTVYAVKEPGKEGLEVRRLAVGPVVPSEKATSGMTYNFIRNVEFFDEDTEEENLTAFLDSVGVELPADPVERKKVLVKLYTSNKIYPRLNKAMYTDDAEELRRHAPYIRALRGVFKRGQSDPLPGFNFFIGSAKKLVKRCELTKEQAEVYQINQKVCWPAFFSTSEADKGGNDAFTGLTFCIRCRDSTEDPNEIQGYFPASIKPWSCFPDENEVLIPPHYMLRVHNINYNKQPANPKKWVIELELADLPPVWDIITQKNWQEFKTWAQAHPDLVDTSKSHSSIINEVVSSLAAEPNETGVDPLKVCLDHGALPNEIDMQTGNTPLTTVALQCLESGKTEQALAVLESLLLAGANPYIKAGPHEESFEQLMPEIDLRLLNCVMGWQYWVDDGVDGKEDGWYLWSEDGSAMLEHAFQEWLNSGHEGRSKLLGVRSDYFSYNVDFLHMKQANTSTGTKRKIRRYRRRSIPLSHDQLRALSEAKLRQELTLLQKLLMRAAVDGLQQATCHLQDAADMLSSLSQMVSATEISAVSSEYEKLVLGDLEDEAKETKETKEAKASLLNLQEACDLNWDTREKVTEVVKHLRDDPHVKLADDLVEGAEAFVTSNNVFQRDGITHAGFRASLSWQNGEKRTDLDMCMTCPECNMQVYHEEKECGCTEDKLCRLNLDIDDRGTPHKSSEENLYMQEPGPFRYKLEVELYSGPPVPFRLQVHRPGQALRVYRVAPHTTPRSGGRIVIFEASVAEGIMHLESCLEHLDVMLSTD